MDNKQLESEISDLKRMIRDLQKKLELHDHSGRGTVRISNDDVVPSIRASGNIEMSTDGQIYRLGIISNPKQILFYGIVAHTTGNVWSPTGPFDIRCIVIGSAQLGKSFYFQPQTLNSVTVGGPPQNIIQSAVYFGNGTGGVHALSGETHLIDVEYPSAIIADIVARATVTEFSVDHVKVQVALQPGWGIIGNFVVT